MASPLYDLELSPQDEIAAQSAMRNRQIAEAMMAKGMQPAQLNRPTGPIAPRHSVLEALAPMAQAYMGKMGIQSSDQQLQDLATKSQEGLRSELDQYFNLREGDNANPREAVVRAMTSPYKSLRAVGTQELAQMGKQTLLPKDLAEMAKQFTPESVAKFMVTRDPRALQHNPKFENFNNTIYNVNQPGANGGPAAIGPAGSPVWGEPYKAPSAGGGEDWYQKNSATGEVRKLDNAPRITNNNNGSPINMGQRKIVESLANKAVDHLDNLGRANQSGNDIMISLQNMESADQQGIYGNVTGPGVQFIQNLSQALKVPVDAKKLANTEGYNMETTKLWMKMIDEAGGARGLTKEETAELKKTLPQQMNSPAGRAFIREKIREGILRKQSYYKQASSAISNALGEDDAQGLGSALTGVYDIPDYRPKAPVDPASFGGRPAQR